VFIASLLRDAAARLHIWFSRSSSVEKVDSASYSPPDPLGHLHRPSRRYAELNDEELQQAILEQTRELADIDPDFAKQLAQQKRATKH
jgi:hypothetical protein